MGDGNASGQLHGMAERNDENQLGFPNLWRGTSTLGCARVVDSGYVHENRAGRGRARMNNNPNIQEWCEQVKKLGVKKVLIFYFRKTYFCCSHSVRVHSLWCTIPLHTLSQYKMTMIWHIVQAMLMLLE